MSGPRWVFQKPFQNATSLFGPGASGQGSGLFGDPGLETTKKSFEELSISEQSHHVSNFEFRQYDSPSDDESKPDPATIKGIFTFHDLSGVL